MNHSIRRIAQEMQVNLNRIESGFLVERSLRELQYHIDQIHLKLSEHTLPVVVNNNKLSTSLVKMGSTFNKPNNI